MMMISVWFFVLFVILCILCVSYVKLVHSVRSYYYSGWPAWLVSSVAFLVACRICTYIYKRPKFFFSGKWNMIDWYMCPILPAPGHLVSLMPTKFRGKRIISFLTFSKLRYARYLIVTLLQVYCWIRWWKNLESRSTFGKVFGKSRVSCF